MLSLFSRNKKTSKNNSNQKYSPNNVELKSKRDGTLEKKVMEGADRELFRYDQPKQELGMSDLIKNHEHGTRFMYAAVTGKESEEIDSKLRRLIAFQPTLKKKSIPLDNLPVIKLYKETEVFPLDSVLPPSGKKSQYGDYIRISDAVTMYGAVVSPDCNFTKISVGITDNRLMTDKLVKSFTATTNLMSKGNLALPYSVPREDADQLVLTISRERSFLEEGRQWGAIQIQLTIEFTQFPMQYENQETTAVNMVTPSALTKPLNNPNNIDISIMNQDRDKLAEMFLEGDIADENEPIENKTQAVRYAKSSVGGQSKGKKVVPAHSDWDFMSSKRVGQVDADQNSIEPSIDDLPDYDQESLRSMSTEEVVRPATPPKPKSKKKVSFGSSDEGTMIGSIDEQVAVMSDEEIPKKFKNNTRSLTPF